MTTIIPLETCALCQNPIEKHPFREESHAFCCPGCQAVFRILSAKNALDGYQEHSLFQLALKSGLISNPALIEQIRKNQIEVPQQELEKWHLQIGDMWCPSCAEVIRLILGQERGVKHCVVDYSTDLASIEFSPRYISKEKMEQTIHSLGYQAQSLSDPNRKAVSLSLYLRFIIAAFCSLNIMMFAYPLYATYFDFDDQGYGNLFAWLSFWMSLPVLFYSAYPILKRFWVSLKVGIFGMETLVVLGVSAAMAFSCYELFKGSNRVYFDSMSVIIVFVLLGKIMEAKAKFSSKDALLRLTQAVPRKGRKRFPDGSERFVPLKEVSVGDTITTLTGEKIVLDGTVIEGEGSCDESLMTGESLPRVKKAGDTVLAGTIVQQGRLAFRVDALPEETALKRIIEMVDHDFGQKSVYNRPVDQFMPWFIPIVLTAACLAGTWAYFLGNTDAGKTVLETAVLRAVAVLLISCPCAIGIAAPLAESHLMNGMALLGAIVRNRGCLKWLGQETVFVFDKTGTITEGRFEVIDGLQLLSPCQKSLLKGLASLSTHPIAFAIKNSLDAAPAIFEKIEEFAGKGLRGMCDQKFYFLGSAAFLQSQGLNILGAGSVLSEAQTEVFFGEETGEVFLLALGDQIRHGAKETLAALAPAKTFLLSGDSFNPVENVAIKCGFKSFEAQCSPLKKREIVDQERNQGEIVCMLGDGINDALALTGAHIGISVVSATDISIQVSDILLTTDRLEVIPKIRALAIKGRQITNQNLFWAFIYNIFGIGLAAMGLLSPIFAAFAMVASSLIVLFNAKRIHI